jgi:AbiV family abortive infection protein
VGCAARACSLAALAVEECGKAAGLTALAVLPRRVRTRAPAGRMLEWHQLKQLGGLLLAAVPPDMPGTVPKLAAMPAAQARQILSALNAPADEADRLKRRGLYVDMDRNGRIREPSEITAAEATSQLAQARQAAASASVLLGPQTQARLANPPAAAIKLARALVRELAQPGNDRTPWAAADAVMNAVNTLHEAAEGAPVPIQAPAPEAPGLKAPPGSGSLSDNSATPGRR